MKSTDAAVDRNFRVCPTGEFCQDCGAPMKEEFRVHQGSVVFVWSECSRTECRSTFLRQEKPTEIKRAEKSRGLSPTTRPWLCNESPEIAQRHQGARPGVHCPLDTGSGGNEK